jgi:hypothetical protein
VTLSVEALTVTSGSPWAGAATMAVLVTGLCTLNGGRGHVHRFVGYRVRTRVWRPTGCRSVGKGPRKETTAMDSHLRASHADRHAVAAALQHPHRRRSTHPRRVRPVGHRRVAGHHPRRPGHPDGRPDGRTHPTPAPPHQPACTAGRPGVLPVRRVLTGPLRVPLTPVLIIRRT